MRRSKVFIVRSLEEVWIVRGVYLFQSRERTSAWGWAWRDCVSGPGVSEERYGGERRKERTWERNDGGKKRWPNGERSGRKGRVNICLYERGMKCKIGSL